MVIDCHVHILNAEDSHLESLLRSADRAGVDKLCICSLSRKWVEFPTAAQLEEAASDVLTACEKHPGRFIGFVYTSADHVDKSLELMDRCLVNGPCRIVKWWISQYADDPRLNPIVEKALELDVPIMAHTWIKATGNMTRESTYMNVVNLAERFPELKIWMAHASGRWEETARGVRDYPNICMDISGGEPEAGIVECLLKHIDPGRIFFGSDAPGRDFSVQMSKITAAEIPRRYKEDMLGASVSPWLKLNLGKKKT